MGIDDKVANIQSIFKLAEKVLGSSELANKWMESEIPSLDHKSPREVLLNEDDGYEKLKSILLKIEHSIY